MWSELFNIVMQGLKKITFSRSNILKKGKGSISLINRAILLQEIRKSQSYWYIRNLLKLLNYDLVLIREPLTSMKHLSAVLSSYGSLTIVNLQSYRGLELGLLGLGGHSNFRLLSQLLEARAVVLYVLNFR